MSAEVARKLFNVDEYYRMAETGILKEDDRVELIEGEIIAMSPIGSRHAACVRICTYAFYKVLSEICTISVQSPLRISPYSEPEPDIAILYKDPGSYHHRHPEPKDVFLIVEVMDTSVEFDRQIKLPLYARAGIPEVWLIDLGRERIEVFSAPGESGYEAQSEFKPGERIRSATLDLEVGVEELLP